MDRAPAPGRRSGYVVAVAINAALLWVTHQLLDWGWPRFLTEDFEELLPDHHRVARGEHGGERAVRARGPALVQGAVQRGDLGDLVRGGRADLAGVPVRLHVLRRRLVDASRASS